MQARRSPCVLLITLFLSVAFLLGGCSDSNDPVTETLSGSFDTAFDLIPIEFTEESEIALADTPIEMTGSFTGFGAASGTIEQQVDFTVVPTGMSGTGRFVLSDDDEIHTSFDATSSFPDENNVISFEGVHTITGGTGRFADATGEATLDGTGNLNTMAMAFTLNGSITYVP
ncbi:MAG: hypothetical protein GVY12_11945 [Bacteroidetes bacterium]|jgi:hypothetical protein|nr:hypothetical protein [Bacteroidota bacterium]